MHEPVIRRIVRPDGEAPITTPDEVGVVIADGEVVHYRDFFQVRDVFHRDPRAIVRRQLIAGSHLLRHDPTFSANEEGMLARCLNLLTADLHANDRRLPRKRSLDDLDRQRAVSIAFRARENFVADAELLDGLLAEGCQEGRAGDEARSLKEAQRHQRQAIC